MKLYGLTKNGRKLARTREDTTPEMKVIRYIFDCPNKTATEDELDVAVEGGHLIARRLVRDQLVVELN